LLLKTVNRKDETAKYPKSHVGRLIKSSDLAAKRLNETYTRWNHAATAGGFIGPHAITPGFIAPSAALPLAGVKFVPHNTPATSKYYNPISPHPAKLPTGG
jgi:hypothetical protein